jgi:hypothetical protein
VADDVLSRVHIGNVHRPETQIGVLRYCGRRNARFGYSESALHNMHNVGECRTCVDHKRHPSGGDTLPYFAVDFGWKVLTEQPAVMRELRDIWRIAARGANVTLLCWCAPAPCHTLIIKRHLRELAT